jgi:hypothetical protein
VNSLHYFKRKDIDVQRWNDAIAQADNSLPYAFTWYLDIVAENWDALVLGNYEAVMPLIWLRKLGVKCLYQPYYCQQLGVFGNSLSKELQHDFLQLATEKFYYININLNPSAESVIDSFGLRSKKNLLLDLSKEYSDLRKKYSNNHIRNIQKAINAGATFSVGIELKHFQKFYLGNINRKRENLKNKHEAIFIKLTDWIVKNKAGEIFSVVNAEGKLLAGSLIIKHAAKRLINIINTSNPEGKSNGASHFLFDNLIRMNAGSDNMLDFEGSSIPGVARFYEGFGAEQETFFNYQTSVLAKQKQLFF